MNKRFQKLAYRAGCRARKFTRGVAMYPNVHEDLQRYGELIVKDCIAKIEEAATHSPELYGVALDILEHFDMEIDDESPSS